MNRTRPARDRLQIVFGREAAQAGDHQLSAAPAIRRIDAHQPFQILMRMQCRNAQQSNPAAHVPARSRRTPAPRRDGSPWNPRHRIARRSSPRGFRYRDQPLRPPRRRPQQQPPERQIEPAEILRMPLVLQIVKHRHVRTGAPRPAHVNPGLNSTSRRCRRAANASPVCSHKMRAGRKPRVHRLRRPVKVGLLRNQIRARFAVGEDDVLVQPIDFEPARDSKLRR